jgi:hypothetical protein
MSHIDAMRFFVVIKVHQVLIAHTLNTRPIVYPNELGLLTKEE